MSKDDGLDELTQLKDRVSKLQQALDAIEPDDWKAYIKVRNSLGSDGALLMEGAEDRTDAGGSTLTGTLHAKVVRCAMVGIFEPANGSGHAGADDTGAVERFAELGR